MLVMSGEDDGTGTHRVSSMNKQIRWEFLSRLMIEPTKWPLRPAKTQISLGIRPVWSETLLSAWRKLGSLATYSVQSRDSDKTGRMPRLIRVFAGRTGNFVGFLLFRLKCALQTARQKTPKCIDAQKIFSKSIFSLATSLLCLSISGCHNSLLLYIFTRSLYYMK